MTPWTRIHRLGTSTGQLACRKRIVRIKWKHVTKDATKVTCKSCLLMQRRWGST